MQPRRRQPFEARKVSMPRVVPSFLAIVAFLGLVAQGCGAQGSTPERDLVVVSFNPLGSIARNLVGEEIGVVAAVSERSVAAGSVGPMPELGGLMRHAKGAVFVGNLDAQAAAAAAGYLPDEQMSLILLEASPTLGSLGEFPWITPEGGRMVARVLAQRLPAFGVDPSRVEENLERFESALDRIEEAISRTVATVPVDQRRAVGSLERLRPLFRYMGYEYVSLEQMGNAAGPGAPPDLSVAKAYFVSSFEADAQMRVATDLLATSSSQRSATHRVGMIYDAVLPGPAGSHFHTYFGLLIENARSVLGASGADVRILDELSPVDVGV